MLKFILLFCLTIAHTFAQDGQYVKMGAAAFHFEEQNILAISLENEKSWHTYWKNPGDAGLELKFKFSTTENDSPIILEDFPWPTPARYIEQGNMWAYGYSNKYAFFYKLPEHLSSKKLKIVGTWLVCKDICIPGTRTVELSLDSNLEGSTLLNHTKNELIESFKKIPIVQQEPKLNIFLTKGPKENQLAVHYILENVSVDQIRQKSNILTPYLQTPFDYKHEEVYFDKSSKTFFGRMYLDWDGLYEEPAWSLPEDGVFKTPIVAKFLLNYPKNAPSKIITHQFNEFTLSGDSELTKRFKGLLKIEDKKSAPSKRQELSRLSLLSYILFAFLGGLILNLMPCVLPVISLKLFGLIIHSDENKKEIFKHNMSYTFGVLFSFFILASTIAILKSTGEQIGWGFQLQSPTFVFAMILIIFIMALNMFGLFQFSTPGGRKLGDTQIKKGLFSDFLNGILATILSTPCSAPFLGTALTFAFTTSIMSSYLIFLSVGAGLAFPFILTAFFPRLIKFLPRPGLWMEKLKFLLGLTLLLTVLWLVDVLFAIVDFSTVGLYFNTVLAFIFFGFFSRRFISKKLWSNILILMITLSFIYKTASLFDHQAQSIAQPNKTDLSWNSWTFDKMNKETERTVFINFTAKWCLTCKVNKKLVLQSNDFKALTKEKGLHLMEGDWTKRDDEITSFLKSYNIVGVPAYFIKKPSGEIISLGETISISKIKKNL